MIFWEGWIKLTVQKHSAIFPSGRDQDYLKLRDVIYRRPLYDEIWFVPPDDVLESGGAEEVLLLQPELLSAEVVVVGVEDAGDVLGEIPLEDGFDVVAVVEKPEVEVAGGFCRPQAEGVDNVVSVSGNGWVVGHGQNSLYKQQILCVNKMEFWWVI